MSSAPQTKNPWTTLTWITITAASVAWWITAAQHLRWRFVLVVGLSLSSFMVGCLVGFLFTSYGEETGTVGKIRDWVIGGITGLTIAKASTIKGLLLTFAAGPGASEYALTISSAVVYAILGFFFMFFQRELILNVLLAQSRAERGRIEGVREVGQVIKSFLVKLPASILSGVDDIDQISAVNKQEADRLRGILYSDEVNAFLEQAEAASAQGNLDWDVVSKAAYIQYYRTYFEKDDKVGQAKRAIDWITRALFMNPEHADLTMKYADMLATQEDYDGAASILERLVLQPDAPVVVRQWLGYYLLYVPTRLEDAIKYSDQYYSLMKGNDALFNMACAYAQAYCRGVELEPSLSKSRENSREKALSYLEEALKVDPEYAEVVRTKWITKGESFDCFASDAQFHKIVGSDDNVASPTEKVAPAPPTPAR
jgi:tetratricopeptide (TPR) repeat protein